MGMKADRGDAPLTDAFVVARVLDRDRLLNLRRSRLLDVREEEAFDRLTRRACLTLGVPVALVSLVDADRQVFKSAQGLSEPFASSRQTPLSHSFCKYVVASGRALVVPDAREVPWLADSPAIAELGVVGYAGVPLSAHGSVLGAFCAIDPMAHDWAPEDLVVLEDLASACSAEVHVRAALREGRRAQGDQRFRAFNALDPQGRHGRTNRSFETRPGALPSRRQGGVDDRRWMRAELAIPVEAAI